MHTIPSLRLSYLFVLPLLLSNTPHGLAETISGTLIMDAGQQCQSHYTAVKGPQDRPEANVPIELRSQEHLDYGHTSTSGAFEFQVPEGQYLICLQDSQGLYSSHNSSHDLCEKISQGPIQLVSFGDSIGRVGSPPYPDYLQQHLAAFAETTLVNVSVNGSEAAQWLPGGSYFENKLRPILASADVVVFTLGGNDLAHAFNGVEDFQDLMTVLVELPALVEQISLNMQLISEAVHQENAKVEVLYLGYMNMMNSEHWQEKTGLVWPLVREGAELIFNRFRAAIAELPYTTIADTMTSMDPDVLIDDYLADSWHANDDGARYYAREAFVSLGGVVVGEEDYALQRTVCLIP